MRVCLLVLLLSGLSVQAVTDENPDPKSNLIDAVAVANTRLADFKEIQERFADSLLTQGTACLRDWPKHSEEYAALEKALYSEFYAAIFNVIDVPNHLNVPPIYPDVVCSGKGEKIQERLTDILELVHQSQTELISRIHKIQALQNEGYTKFINYGVTDLNRSFRCLFAISYKNAVAYAFRGTRSIYAFANDSIHNSNSMFSQSYEDLDEIKNAFDLFEGDVKADVRRFNTIKKACDKN